MLKVATLAPMPSAKVRIATTIKPGFLASVRQAKRTSRRNKPICHPPWCWIAREWLRCFCWIQTRGEVLVLAELRVFLHFYGRLAMIGAAQTSGGGTASQNQTG